jgi:energy-coupling factor transport system substrate-specific component
VNNACANPPNELESDASGPNRRFTLRDVVFAAVSAAGLLLVGFVTVPLVLHVPIPGIRNLVSAPLSAVVLTVAAARIGRPFTLMLVVGLSSLVYLLISPVIPLFTLSAALMAELTNLALFRGYQSRRARMVCITVLYTAMTPLGTLFGAWLLGGAYREALTSAPVLLGITGGVALLTLGGAWIGERVVTELRRGGRLG